MKFAAAAVLASFALVPASAQIVRQANPAGYSQVGSLTVPAGMRLTFVSGQVATALDPRKPANSIDGFGDTKTQTISALHAVEGKLKEQGLGLQDVVKINVYLVGDPKLGGRMDFKGFLSGYSQFFGTPDQPNKVVRTTVQVTGLANPGFLVEVEATAAK